MDQTGLYYVILHCTSLYSTARQWKGKQLATFEQNAVAKGSTPLARCFQGSHRVRGATPPTSQHLRMHSTANGKSTMQTATQFALSIRSHVFYTAVEARALSVNVENTKFHSEYTHSLTMKTSRSTQPGSCILRITSVWSKTLALV